jgi:hypothetical protein
MVEERKVHSLLISLEALRTEESQCVGEYGLRGVHGFSDHGEVSNRGNRSKCSRYRYSVSKGIVLKSI